MQVNWIFGITWCVFFVASKFNSEMQAMFCGRILPSLYSFLVVAIFAKTECYSPSNLLVRSAMCRTSATYQLSTCRKRYVHHSKHSMIILVTKPISITPVLSLARKASEKILPVKTITQGKSKPLVENIFSYQSFTGAWVHWQCQPCVIMHHREHIEWKNFQKVLIQLYHECGTTKKSE